jgi:hypothetical protein
MVPGPFGQRRDDGRAVTHLRALDAVRIAHPERERADPASTSPSGFGRRRVIEEGDAMLWTILVVLIVLWALGLLASVGGAAIHLLLVLALVVLVVQLLSGRRSVY